MKTELVMFNFSTWLTVSRIFLSTCIVSVIYQQQWIIASILFIVAALTDFFDGYYARLYQQETEFGRLLDPVADKILIFSTLFALHQMACRTSIPWWFMALVFGKDCIMMAGAVFLLLQKKHVIIPPSLFSKCVTALLMLFLLYLMLVDAGMASWCNIDWILYCFAMMMIIIWFDYVAIFFKSL